MRCEFWRERRGFNEFNRDNEDSYSEFLTIDEFTASDDESHYESDENNRHFDRENVNRNTSGANSNISD